MLQTPIFGTERQKRIDAALSAWEAELDELEHCLAMSKQPGIMQTSRLPADAPLAEAGTNESDHTLGMAEQPGIMQKTLRPESDAEQRESLKDQWAKLEAQLARIERNVGIIRPENNPDSAPQPVNSKAVVGVGVITRAGAFLGLCRPHLKVD